MKRTVSGILLTLLFISVLSLALDTQSAKASGAVHIRIDGSVEPSDVPIHTTDNVTYMFTGNIYDEIIVERDDIVVDGAGYVIQGYWSGNGIYLSGRNNVTIKNMQILLFAYGIRLFNSSNISIVENNLTSPAYLPISNFNGIYLDSSSNNNIIGNNVEKCGINGILLHNSSNNVLRYNSMAGNLYNFGVWGRSSSHFVNDVDTSNTVEGKPIYYWINEEDMSVPLDAGYVALINCTHINVQNLNLANNEQAILLISTSDSTLVKNDIATNDYGIFLANSTNNTISKNNLMNNYNSFWLSYSSYNTMSGNNITNNRSGIMLDYSSFNSISENIIEANDADGILLDNSLNNTISRNNITANNLYAIRLLYSSYHNRIFHNNFVKNQAVSFGYGSLWDNGYPSGGNYWSDYNGTDLYSGPYQNETGSDGIGDTPYIINEDNADDYPLTNPWSWHDIAVVEVIPSRSWVYQGHSFNINITVLNEGDFAERVTVALYYNMTANQVIGTQTITLDVGESQTLVFKWDTEGVEYCHNYTITAVSSIVPRDEEPTDNTLDNAYAKIRILGDTDGDGVVNMEDIYTLMLFFLSEPGDPRWNSDVDLIRDNTINWLDIYIAILHFMETEP